MQPEGWFVPDVHLTRKRVTRAIARGSAAALLLLSSGTNVLAQQPQPLPSPVVTTPASSIPIPADTGVRFHTNLQFLGPAKGYTGKNQVAGPPFGPGLFFETPGSLGCLYGFTPAVAGCNPYLALANPSGGARTIVIVDAYDNPTIALDSAVFTAQFGVTPLGPGNFEVVYAPFGGDTPGSCRTTAPQPLPSTGTGWALEASLDIQYAHAMAPKAKIILVEAQSNSNIDLDCGVVVANKILQSSGGGEISMSFGGSEYPEELLEDPIFTAPGVVYFASTGDDPGVIYPSVSPNVVAVGGTSTSRNALTGNFRFENTWQSAGGGMSLFEPRPSYQNGIVALVGGLRGIPDIAADANPTTGVWVFNSSYDVADCPSGCWFVVGGTSLSSPLWAGITNAAGGFSASSAAELTKIYGAAASGFNDISVGTCGLFMGEVSAAGWDFCTGRGSPKTYVGK
jgi:subtilase family serine protease